MNILHEPSRKGDTRRIASIGMYDGMHLGHTFLIGFLRREAELRGLTPMVITFSRHPREVVEPGSAPGMLCPLHERLDLLEREGVADCLVLDFSPRLQGLSAEAFLGMLHDDFGVDVLVMGFNNRFGGDNVADLTHYLNIGHHLGVDIIRAPEFMLPDERGRVSSSRIRHMLADGDIEAANHALGRPYSIEGTVGQGRRVGTKLGFPTANLRPSDPLITIPADGVYAARAITPDGLARQAVVNIGTCPTFADTEANGEPQRSIEAHIIGFSGYLYDEPLRLEFISRLRDERRFGSPAELAAQLERDVQQARKMLDNYIPNQPTQL